jgi:L-lactate permease
MSKNDWLFLTIVVVFLSFVVYLVSIIIPAAAEIVSAFIGLAGLILAATLKYSFEMEKSRTQALQIEKQKNYQKLFKNIGEFIRDQDNKVDPLCITHIES